MSELSIKPAEGRRPHWISAFAGMTEGASARVRHAGERRHPGVVPETRLVNPNEYDAFATQTYRSGSTRLKPLTGTMADADQPKKQRARERPAGSR